MVSAHVAWAKTKLAGLPVERQRSRFFLAQFGKPLLKLKQFRIGGGECSTAARQFCTS